MAFATPLRAKNTSTSISFVNFPRTDLPPLWGRSFKFKAWFIGRAALSNAKARSSHLTQRGVGDLWPQVTRKGYSFIEVTVTQDGYPILEKRSLSI